MSKLVFVALAILVAYASASEKLASSTKSNSPKVDLQPSKLRRYPNGPVHSQPGSLDSYQSPKNSSNTGVRPKTKKKVIKLARQQPSQDRPAYAPLTASETRAQGVHVTGDDLKAEAGHHGGHGHHGYFQYARVPHKGAWEFGFRRGNHGHFKERHEHGKGNHFKTKVRWGDKHGGYGEHFWDYNHHGKHHDHHHKHHHAGAAGAAASSAAASAASS